LDQVGLTGESRLQPGDSSIFGAALPAEAEVDDHPAEGEGNAALSDIGGEDQFVSDAAVEEFVVEFIGEEGVDFDDLVGGEFLGDEEVLEGGDFEEAGQEDEDIALEL
jgi:hypothetical protein